MFYLRVRRLCDPRFKKLTFKHDRMLTDAMRTNATKWFTAEFNRKYKEKFSSTAADQRS